MLTKYLQIFFKKSEISRLKYIQYALIYLFIHEHEKTRTDLSSSMHISKISVIGINRNLGLYSYINRLVNARLKLYLYIKKSTMVSIKSLPILFKNTSFQKKKKLKRKLPRYKLWRGLKFKLVKKLYTAYKQKNKNFIKTPSSTNKFKILKFKIPTSTKLWTSKIRLNIYKTRKRKSLKNFRYAYNDWSLKNKITPFVYTNILKKKHSLKHKYRLKIFNKFILYRTKKRALRSLKKFFNIRYKIFLKPKKHLIKSVFKTQTKPILTSWNKFNPNTIFTEKFIKIFNLGCLMSLELDKFKLSLQPKPQSIDLYKSIHSSSTSKSLPTIFYKKKNLLSVKTLFFKKLFCSNSSEFYNNYSSIKLLNTTPHLNLDKFNKVGSSFKKSRRVHYVTEKLSLVPLNSTKLYFNAHFDKIYSPYVFTNYTPLFFFPLKGKKNSLQKSIAHLKMRYYATHINLSVTNKYKNFFIFFIISFLEDFLKKKIWLRVVSKDPFNSFWKKYINSFCKKHMFQYKRFNRILPIREILEILILSFKTVDLQIFLMYIQRKFEILHFKKHKKALSILFDVIRKNRIIFSLCRIKGFSFDIRGKVGVSGNAKKRHIFFSHGKITTTSQNVKSHWQQTSVWTPTGQMGITCLLQY